MDIFERLLKLFGRDYWSLSDKELEQLAHRHRLNDYHSQYKDTGFTSIGFDVASRKKIIEQLVFRDKFASSFVAVLISLIALVVSTLVAIFK